MSVLAYPRIHFKGKCSINPATGNNNDVQINLDDVNVALSAQFQNLSDEEARGWMMEGVQAIHPTNKKLHWYLKSGWNYYGDMSFQFSDAAVTAVTLKNGRTNTSDPIVGKPVHLLGSAETVHEFGRPLPVLCDVDPQGSALTQLFLGQFLVGESPLRLVATRNTRAFSRWVLWRNTAIYEGEQNFPACGATWQFAMPHTAIEFDGATASPALAELQHAGSARGIVVQFCLYFPIPEFTDEQLMVDFRLKQFHANPVKSFLLGTIGVWEDNELETAPAGRLLLPAIPTVLGPAVARVQSDANIVSLNLISTFPESDYLQPPAKYDFGQVRLGIIKASGGSAVAFTSPIAYDYPTYEGTSGILDVAYDPNVVSPTSRLARWCSFATCLRRPRRSR